MVSTSTVEPTPASIDRHDWLILNALSDDYESVEQIVKLVNTPEQDWPEVTPLKVIDRVERLFHAGYLFLTFDAKFDRDAIVQEIDQTLDRKFWFGRTPSGEALWQKYSAEYYPE
jgi:hypothetical protein